MSEFQRRGYVDRYLGQRCFILGNSPSLAKEKLSLLKNEKVFICNKGWLAKEIGLMNYNFYVLGDPKQAEIHRTEIEKNINCEKFLSSAIDKNLFNFDFVPYQRLGVKKFISFPESYDSGWGKTRTVVLDATLIAYFMGFKEIYLLGVTLDYSSTNNHFYQDSELEIRYRDKLPKRLPEILKIIQMISNHLKNNNVKFVNLTKDFKFQQYMDIDILENIIK